MHPLVDRSDQELLAAAATGDGHAFATFYDRHAGGVFGYCRRILDDDEDAADAAQEAFLSVLARVHAGPGSVTDPAAYLFRTARNASLRTVAARRRTRPVEEVPEARGAGELPEGESKVLTEDLQAAVRAANRELPVRQREVLALREVEELSYEEIGERMELSANAAAQLAWRARGRFRSIVRRGALGGITLRTLDCDRAMTLTTLAEDGLLPPRDAEWLDEHLDECDRCRASRAIMAEAGATYRLWVPGAALVVASREGLFVRAGEVVGADWSALGPAGAVGTGPGASPRGKGAGAGALVAAVLAALALAVGGGALVLTGGGGGGEATGGGGGASGGGGGASGTGAGGGGAGGGAASAGGNTGAAGDDSSSGGGEGGPSGDPGGTLAAVPPALAGVLGSGGAGDGADAPVDSGGGGVTGTAPSRDPAGGGLTPAPVVRPPAREPDEPSRPVDVPRPADEPPAPAPSDDPAPGPVVGPPPAEPPAEPPPGPPPPPPPRPEPPPPPPPAPPEPPPPPGDDDGKPGRGPKDKDGDDGCPWKHEGKHGHCPPGHDKRG